MTAVCEGEGQGCALFSVKGDSGEVYDVAICLKSGEAWCSCPQHWFRIQPNGIPNASRPNECCKHVREALRSQHGPVVKDSWVTPRKLASPLPGGNKFVAQATVCFEDGSQTKLYEFHGETAGEAERKAHAHLSEWLKNPEPIN
ncbi:hypothetical protein EON82_26365 [bacterium]|nr:MAG: hypothetical protein EON82_26365 [bacterium]